MDEEVEEEEGLVVVVVSVVTVVGVVLGFSFFLPLVLIHMVDQEFDLVLIFIVVGCQFRGFFEGGRRGEAVLHAD